MSQKQGSPFPGNFRFTQLLSVWNLLVNLSPVRWLPALPAAIPGASDIETRHKPHFVRLHSTLLPQAAGRRLGRRLASPLHGTLTPGRISVGRPPFGRTGVSLSLTELSRYSLPSAVFGRVGTARHLLFGPLIEASREMIPPSFPLPLQMVLAHPPLSLASLVKRPRQERIQVFGYSIFKVLGYQILIPGTQPYWL